MWKFLDKLRAMPEESRKAITLFSSFFITGILLVSWFVFPTPHFGTLSAEEQERKPAEELLAPFSALGEEIGTAADGIKNDWSSLGGTAGIVSFISEMKDAQEAKNTSSAIDPTP